MSSEDPEAPQRLRWEAPMPRAHASTRGPNVLVALGILLIAAGVLRLLNASEGPGPAHRTFAERRSYDQVKVDLHRAFPVAGLCASLGLGLTLAGRRWRARRLATPPTGDPPQSGSGRVL